jgi:riboflavin biosynthesis pyrimidine reductase
VILYRRVSFVLCQTKALINRPLSSGLPITATIPGAIASSLDLGQVVDELGQRPRLSVLVEGGSEVHWSFLAHKLVDKFYFIVGALVLGGKRSVPAVGGRGFPSVEAAHLSATSMP